MGIKNGRIAAVGKAGNPDTQPNVDIVVGPGSEVLAGEGMILTAGGIDSHIHFICPQQIDEALMSGVTTMLGGGTGPATGTNGVSCIGIRVSATTPNNRPGKQRPDEPGLPGKR